MIRLITSLDVVFSVSFCAALRRPTLPYVERSSLFAYLLYHNSKLQCVNCGLRRYNASCTRVQ